MPRPDSTEVDLTTYKDKEATTLHKELAAWICEQTGYDPDVVKSKKQVFLDAIRLGATMRMLHQASPENQASIIARREATAQKATEAAAAKPAATEPKAARRPAAPKAEKATPAKAAKTAPKVEPVAEPAEAAKPATAPRRRPAKAAAGSAAAPF